MNTRTRVLWATTALVSGIMMAGAASANAIPQTATARITGGDLNAVAAALEKARDAFIAQHAAQGAGAVGQRGEVRRRAQALAF